MKYFFILMLAAAVCIGCSSQQKTGAVYESSQRYGEAMGYRSIIRVKVGTENGNITDITIVDSREDRAVGGEAIYELIDLVIMYNSTEIDAISGATETSKGFLRAVENAILNHE